MNPRTYVDVLSREECLRLLPTIPVGWIAYCHASRPQLVPVNFVLDAGEVLVRTGYGDKLAAAAHESVMTVAVSSIDSDARTGWSVTVTGRARLIDDVSDVASPELAALAPWAPGDKDFYIGVQATDVSGRRISATH